MIPFDLHSAIVCTCVHIVNCSQDKIASLTVGIVGGAECRSLNAVDRQASAHCTTLIAGASPSVCRTIVPATNPMTSSATITSTFSVLSFCRPTPENFCSKRIISANAAFADGFSGFLAW